MRKVLCAALAFALSFCASVPSFAGQAGVNTDIDVEAKYSENFGDIHTLVLGKAEALSLTGGQSLTAKETEGNDKGIRLVVTPVLPSDTQAYAWVSSKTSDTGRNPYAYHVAFYKGNKSVKPQGAVAVKLSVPAGYETASFLYMDKNGRTEQIRTQKSGSYLSFTVQEGGYYVFLNPLPDRRSEDDGESSSSTLETMTIDRKKGHVHSEKGILTGTTGSRASDGYSHWMLDDKGWKLRYADGTYASGALQEQKPLYCWEKINGSWFVFGTDSYALFNWVYDSSSGLWYYLDVNTGMKTGWHDDVSKGCRYYFDLKTGAMVTGWREINGKWYYFNPGDSSRPYGAMYRNARTPDGYYTDETGAWDGR